MEPWVNTGEQGACGSGLWAVQPDRGIRPDAGQKSQPGGCNELVAVVGVAARCHEVDVLGHRPRLTLSCGASIFRTIRLPVAGRVAAHEYDQIPIFVRGGIGLALG
ncbi:hypothetical protein ABQG64_01905, partial [Escherichia coli]